MHLNKFKKESTHNVYFLKYFLWYLTSTLFFNSSIPGSKIRSILLKLFGCNIGKNIIIKPNVKIKYPWKLIIGEDVWIGENVWIDNISKVTIGSNTCISQGVYICSGSHNFHDEEFGLLMQDVEIGNNCWIAAKSLIGPGVKIEDSSFIKFGSVVLKKYSLDNFR
jgi:putative colanic acid biosynthesis acetyltransferase WcaF